MTKTTPTKREVHECWHNGLEGLEQLLEYLDDLGDIRLIVIHGSPFVPNSYGRCIELNRLTNKRNC